MTIGNVNRFVWATALVFSMLGCSTVSSIRPESHRDASNQSKLCVKTEYEYSRNSYSNKDDFSYKQEVQKMSEILNAVIKNYGIETKCERIQKSYLVSINKVSPFKFFSWYSLWGAISSVTVGLIPFKEPFEMAVTITDIDKKLVIVKKKMEFESYFSTFNTENSKRISKQNREDYGEADHILAPLGAQIALAIQKDSLN